ncbi:class I SAM-dependent methyltransferase [Paeniglutamicibacter psychrophenolicus]|uniref:class I SAM-dependent methyltransferase n=1 Tax=Paeniglutamicibacter psychrophenolicus TaxID=257454 RepID=UPI0027814ABD|nr:methyltransferase [Paeniglutamicibacter psychrophenolicus]MDQ0094945.1 16S rRNA G1207 methylase RsmC [Paeniglutamicibacter psychrophenolicus]
MSPEHYFSAQPSTPEKRRTISVELGGATRKLQSSGGVFSPDRIDKGTAVLLRGVPAPAPEGNLLDIGCGWGPIALSMALASPEATVHAVDVNERSLALTRDNAAALGLKNVVVALPDDVDPARTYNTIWSNPPIRIGKEALHELLLLWLPRLSPGGEAWLVVQKNLGADSLQKWLGTVLPEDWNIDRVSTDKAFRILKVVRPEES